MAVRAPSGSSLELLAAELPSAHGCQCRSQSGDRANEQRVAFGCEIVRPAAKGPAPLHNLWCGRRRGVRIVSFRRMKQACRWSSRFLFFFFYFFFFFFWFFIFYLFIFFFFVFFMFFFFFNFAYFFFFFFFFFAFSIAPPRRTALEATTGAGFHRR